MSSTETADIQPAYLYLWPGKFLYVGSSLQTKVHGHHAMQLAISTTKPFKMKLSDSWEDFQAVLIRQDFQHECILDDKHVLFLGIDPESSEAQALDMFFLKGETFKRIPESFVSQITESLQLQLKENPSPESVSPLLEKFLQDLTGAVPILHSIDPRLLAVIEHIAGNLPGKIRVRDLANAACLSESRLIHLFKEEIGIPIRVYIQWNRLIHAVYAIVQGVSLTEAALEAGFSDSAHFSRIFTRMLGTPPSGLLKNSQNVQAYICSI
jgi:AraC-like DNA-binding protein